MPRLEDPKRNRLLASLPDDDLDRLLPHLTFVELAKGRVLHEPGVPQHHAYFPTTAVVSKQFLLASGKSSEVAVVGNEGVIGMSLLLGTSISINQSDVLVTGHAFRIGAQAIHQEFCTSASARVVMLLYFQALITQVAQNAICNRFHTIEQQVCGFLLHTLDRTRDDCVLLTQDHLATMLGVRRESVTAAVGHLRRDGIVRLSRGHIDVLDLQGLEHRSCECHAVVKHEYDRLLPLPLQPATPLPIVHRTLARPPATT